jgi:hypothetical protein
VHEPITRGPDPIKHGTALSKAVPVILALGVILRFVILILTVRSGVTFWSTGNDAEAFILLARNLVNHLGFSYAGVPTAFRPVLYPWLISVMMRLAPERWLELLRALQLVSALITAWACGILASRWGGSRSLAIGLALWVPTLIFFQPEVGTETFFAMFVVLWLACLTYAPTGSSIWIPAAMGVLAGLATLQRFNGALLIVIGPLVQFYYVRNWKRAALALAIGILFVAPWIVRNWIELGSPVFSTETGYAMVVGIVSPTSRTQPGDTEAILLAIGWFGSQIESNSAPPNLRNEVQLNREAVSFAIHHWFDMPRNWPTKLAAFCLSWDQWSAISGVPRRGQIIRRAAVLFYWVILCAAGFALWRLTRRTPYILFYIGVVIIMHLPLTMSTRVRVPLFDPLLCSLAACAMTSRTHKEPDQEGQATIATVPPATISHRENA